MFHFFAKPHQVYQNEFHPFCFVCNAFDRLCWKWTCRFTTGSSVWNHKWNETASHPVSDTIQFSILTNAIDLFAQPVFVQQTLSRRIFYKRCSKWITNCIDKSSNSCIRSANYKKHCNNHNNRCSIDADYKQNWQFFSSPQLFRYAVKIGHE